MDQSINSQIDPMERLPVETFVNLFPFLPLATIASSSAVNRTWREAILSDPTLHQEIDLTKLDGIDAEDLDNILDHIDRFSDVSFDNLKKVSLNLNALCHNHLTLNEEADSPKDYDMGLITIVLVHHLSFSQTIKTFSFSITDVINIQYNEGETFIFLFHLLNPFLALNDDDEYMFPNLKKVYLQMGSPINLQLGNDSTNMLCLTDNSHGTAYANRTSVSYIFGLTYMSRDWVGSGITKYQLGSGLPLESEGIDEYILDPIKSSKSTLEDLVLNLEFPDNDTKRDTLLSAATCSNLTSLSLNLLWDPEYDPHDDEEEPLVLGNELRCSKLKKLHIETDLSLDWESLAKWVEDASLEDLRIDLTRPASLTSLISNSTMSLKKLFLMFPTDSNQEQKVGDLPSFPNLWALNLEVPSSFFNSFSSLDAPNLTCLSIRATNASTSDAYNCLTKLLEKYDQNLTHLDLSHLDYQEGNPIQCNLKRLEWLQIHKDCDEGIFKWFSHMVFPDLETQAYSFSSTKGLRRSSLKASSSIPL